jgi:hypothetical protein
MSPPPETPPPAPDRDTVAVLTERVVMATGAGNLTHLALSPRLLDRVPAEARRALSLRLGLDRIRDGGPTTRGPSMRSRPPWAPACRRHVR